MISFQVLQTQITHYIEIPMVANIILRCDIKCLASHPPTL